MDKFENSPGKAALITGGAQRIGKAVALLLADSGWNIVLHYNTSRKDAENTAQEIRENQVACEIIQSDLSQESESVHLVSTAVKLFPGLSLLVNNASGYEKASISETTVEIFNRIFAVNVKTPFFLIRDFARLCGRGHIINIIDAGIMHPDYHYAAYILTKRSLAHLTELAAREFGPAVRVNGIAPGIILPPHGETDAFLDRKSAQVPMKRKGSPDDVARAVLFLTENDYITGQILYVDGGEHL